MKTTFSSLTVGLVWLLGGASVAMAAEAAKSGLVALTVSKAQGYRQTGPETLVPEPEAPFALSCVAVVESANLGTVLVHPPGGGEPQALSPLDAPAGTVPAWAYGESFDTVEDRDGKYADGMYSAVIRYSMAGDFAEMTVSASLPNGSDANVPRLLNFDDIRCVDSSRSLTLQLARFERSSLLDQASVEVRENGPDLGVTYSGAASEGPDGSWVATVPAGVLQADREYTVRVSYMRVLGMGQTNQTLQGSSARAMGVILTSRSASNRFVLATLGCPRLRILREHSEDEAVIRFESVRGTVYQIEESTDLKEWKLLSSTNATGAFVEVRHRLLGEQGGKFVRVVRR